MLKNILLAAGALVLFIVIIVLADLWFFRDYRILEPVPTLGDTPYVITITPTPFPSATVCPPGRNDTLPYCSPGFGSEWNECSP